MWWAASSKTKVKEARFKCSCLGRRNRRETRKKKTKQKQKKPFIYGWRLRKSYCGAWGFLLISLCLPPVEPPPHNDGCPFTHEDRSSRLPCPLCGEERSVLSAMVYFTRWRRRRRPTPARNAPIEKRIQGPLCRFLLKSVWREGQETCPIWDSLAWDSSKPMRIVCLCYKNLWNPASFSPWNAESAIWGAKRISRRRLKKNLWRI